MAARRLTLSDDTARRDAVAVRDRSLLVEAGAGSGKTAVMAGRIAMLLAGGVAPRSVVAVTFTEFAASELLIRVRAFVSALAAGEIPVELRSALPDGLPEEQCGNLARADAALDEMTCSTIPCSASGSLRPIRSRPTSTPAPRHGPRSVGVPFAGDRR